MDVMKAASLQGNRARRILGGLSAGTLSLILHGAVAALASLSLIQRAGTPGSGSKGTDGGGAVPVSTGTSFQVDLRSFEEKVTPSFERDVPSFPKVLPDEMSNENDPAFAVPTFDPFTLAENEAKTSRQVEPSELARSRPNGAFERLPNSESRSSPRGSGVPGGDAEKRIESSSGSGDATGKGNGTGGTENGTLVAVYSPKPEYPLSAKRRKIEGVTVVEFVIQADGMIAGAKVVEGSGCEALDQAALETVRTWKYQPPKGDGPAAIVPQRIRFVFKLQD